MLKALLFSLPFFLLAQSPLEMESLLFQADEISHLYNPLVAKAPVPNPLPQTDPLLLYAPNWFSIDLSLLKTTQGQSTLATLNQERFWQALAEMGIQGVELKGLKAGGTSPIRLQIDPKLGTEEEYRKVADLALKNGVHMIGSLLGSSTGKGADFALALKNVGSYPSLFALIEIMPQDWEILPLVKPNAFSTNIPWLTIQSLHKMGYIPTEYFPYTKESEWNATEPIRCIDQKIRRWVYLRDENGLPRLNWLTTSFSSLRIASADALFCMFRLGQPIVQFDATWPQTANETMSLIVRKIGGFSVSLCRGGVKAFTRNNADALYDHLTPIASLHALIAQDAEALRLMYRLLLEEKIALKRLVHSLEPFGRFPCDWAEFIQNGKKKYQYCQEEWSGEGLRQKLLEEDRFRIEGTKIDQPLTGWSDACAATLGIEDLEKNRDRIFSIQLLLARFFALQPGPFCISAQDLIGSSPAQTSLNLFGPNCESLYSTIPNQLQNPRSFASQLKEILRIRSEYGIHRATLIDVPTPEHKGVFILRYQLPESRTIAILAVNFGKEEAIETIESSEYVRTTAINLLTGRSENKLFDSSFLELKLESLCVKLILLQPKYYR